jgi:hypothetical protein
MNEISDFRVPTLTLNELAALFRRVGISTTEVKLADGIEQGVYPFGVCIRSAKGRNFEIYEQKVLEYLSERSAR